VLRNSDGVEVHITPVGASIQRLIVPIAGAKRDVVLGFNKPSSYAVSGDAIVVVCVCVCAPHAAVCSNGGGALERSRASRSRARARAAGHTASRCWLARAMHVAACLPRTPASLLVLAQLLDNPPYFGALVGRCVWQEGPDKLMPRCSPLGSMLCSGCMHTWVFMLTCVLLPVPSRSVWSCAGVSSVAAGAPTALRAASSALAGRSTRWQ
jgi:hypothetical protein